MTKKKKQSNVCRLLQVEIIFQEARFSVFFHRDGLAANNQKGLECSGVYLDG